MFQSLAMSGGAVGVGVLDQGDGLALSRDTGGVERIQAVDGLVVLRRDLVAADREQLGVRW